MPPACFAALRIGTPCWPGSANPPWITRSTGSTPRPRWPPRRRPAAGCRGSPFPARPMPAGGPAAP
ncbi:hypothetical protein XF14_35845, partial [Burkholderia gladioli]